MELLIVWTAVGVLFGWWGSALSSNKARGGTLGCVLGFFLGILGVLIIALMSANTEGQWNREESWRRQQGLGQEPPLTRRPQRLANPPQPVRSTNPPRSSRLSPPPDEVSGDVELRTSATEGGLHCTHCGAATTPDAKFCAACGTAITATNA